jgi:hypothetical protein
MSSTQQMDVSNDSKSSKPNKFEGRSLEQLYNEVKGDKEMKHLLLSFSQSAMNQTEKYFEQRAKEATAANNIPITAKLTKDILNTEIEFGQHKGSTYQSLFEQANKNMKVLNYLFFILYTSDKKFQHYKIGQPRLRVLRMIYESIIAGRNAGRSKYVS